MVDCLYGVIYYVWSQLLLPLEEEGLLPNLPM